MVGISLCCGLMMPVMTHAAGNPADPILVLYGKGIYSAYIGEVLRAEGLNAFQEKSLPDPVVGLPYLKKFDVVVLSETSLTVAQCDMLEKFVGDGGNLVALHPDKIGRASCRERV